MCGRFVLVTDLKTIQKNFNVHEVFCQYQPSWNIAPSQLIPAIIHHGNKNLLVCFRWGLIPSWFKDPSMTEKMFNARAETVDKKPSFRDAFKKRRCLIIADGFYEWKKEGNRKMPLYYYLKSGRPFGFAGLYVTWLSPDKKEISTCTIITTAANELIAPVHDRMPVILSPEQEKTWLESDAADAANLKSILKPYPAEAMDCRAGMGPHDDTSLK